MPKTNRGAKNVHQEIIMILQANAVIDPGAVMVKPLNTLVAYGAMTRPGCSDGLTVRT